MGSLPLNPNWAPERVRSNFRLDLFAGICAGVFIAVLNAFMAVEVRRAGGSTSEVALVVAAPFIGHLVSPFLVYLFQGMPPVRVVSATVLASRLVFIVGVLVATTPLFLAATTVVSFVIVLGNIAAYTGVMVGIYPDRERATAMGKVRIGVSIAGIASAALAGVFIDVVPAGWVFAVAAVLSLPGVVAFWRIRHDPGPIEPRRPASAIVATVWADRQYRTLLASFVIYGTGNLSNFAVLPILLIDRYQAPSTFIGIYAALQSVAAIVAYYGWGRLLDRRGSLRLTLYNSLLVALIPIAFVTAPDVWWLLPAAIVAGITAAGGELTFHMNAMQLAPRGRVGDYATVNSFLLGVRGTIAPFLAAMLLGVLPASAVILVGLSFMGVGLAVMSRAVHERPPALILEPEPEPAAAS
ncbi:MAG TPA: MFS transporter [Candidatus Limnocylindria bacterium]|nr:MFS transporter [Candidatus Limnocylindria bacterium]